MILVNGCDGIGTGWSTNIPCFNPLDICDNLKRKLRGENFIEIKPWYKGFCGEIIKNNDNKECRSYVVNGKININFEKEIVEINELPVKVFTRDYKNFLEKNHIDNKEVNNKDFEIEDIKEYHTDNKISFVIKLTEKSFNNIKNKSKEELLKLFKLSSTLNTSNMVLFNHENKIHKYNLIEEIFEEFYNVRLEFYEKRKKFLLDKIGFTLEKNENKKKFIIMFLNGEIDFKRSKNKKDIISILKKSGFKSNGELKNKYKEAFKINSTEVILKEENENNENNENNLEFADNDFDYLMNMNMWNLTPEKINELDELIKNQKSEFEKIKKNSIQEIWIKDLETFEIEYMKILNELDGKNKEIENKIKIMKDKQKEIKKRKKRKTKKIEEEIESDESSSENESDNSDKMSIYSDEEESSKKKVIQMKKIIVQIKKIVEIIVLIKKQIIIILIIIIKLIVIIKQI
jgi:DNA topoisomerase-2